MGKGALQLLGNQTGLQFDGTVELGAEVCIPGRLTYIVF
jgi:hypothetical protein